MRGNIKYQVAQIYSQSGIKQIGESRHAAKELARAEGAKKPDEIGKKTGIHSYATADAYRDVWRQAGNFCKDNYGVKDLEKMKGEHARAFLLSKVKDGVARQTFKQYASALEKLGTALNWYSARYERGNSYDFTKELKDVRALGRELPASKGARAYTQPRQLLIALEQSNFRAAAALQNNNGLRLDELRTISLKGNSLASVRGKGGKIREIRLHPNLEKYLSKNLEAGQRGLRINEREYRAALKQAAEATGQRYTGSHGLRWNYAQDRFQQLQADGLPRDLALSQVSAEMGHERADITEHYLG